MAFVKADKSDSPMKRKGGMRRRKKVPSPKSAGTTTGAWRQAAKKRTTFTFY